MPHDMACERQPRVSAVGYDDRLRELLALHFHPDHGSRYWLRRQDRLGWDVRDRVRTVDDLWLLGPTPLDDLRRFPLPRLHPAGRCTGSGTGSCVGETAGTSGQPLATAYRDDEFQEAFVTPFLLAAGAAGFPRGRAVAVGRAVRAAHHRQGGARVGPADRQPGPVQRRFRSRAGPSAWPTARWPDSAISITSSARRWTCWSARRSACCSPRRRP